SLITLYSLLIIPLTPTSTLFPYTTLFRSRLKIIFFWLDLQLLQVIKNIFPAKNQTFVKSIDVESNIGRFIGEHEEIWKIHSINRSEEHTSELQSRENLVCRLLLEKKKKNE